MERLDKAWRSLNENSVGLWLSREVAETREALEPLCFLRDYVARNTPLVVRGGCSHWPAIEKWRHRDYLLAACPGEITVALTLDGRADAVHESGSFVLPLERRMKLQEFYRLLDRANQHSSQQTPIPYIQRQNSSLTEELPSLCGDVSPPFPWASQVFGGEADAINVWIGGSRSTSSLHKDPYENLYGVVTGAKTFVLIPPHSTPWLYRRFYPVSQLDSELQPRLLDPPQQTPWIPLDPDSPSVLDDFPQFANAVSLRVTLYPGDVLYLPSLWYHQVGQIGPETIAVNYWYDMKHDSRYAWSCFQDELLLDQPASDP
ncbi:hypothetical protein HDV03_002263 [Kappamyces sp. JEL0829]|nr:hypothetical protein HDV03_002263 [Kappamyces sp. JEL0829]